MESEFTRLSALLEADSAKREVIAKEVKEINRIFRAIQFTLHQVHNVVNDEAGVANVCRQSRLQFQELAPIWQRIFSIIGDESAEKYRAHWRFASEQLVFLGAFTYWLETRSLITLDQAVEMIGVGTNQIYSVPAIPATAATAASSIPAASAATVPGVGLDLDDYLQGLTAVPKELTRLCVNAVRTGNYTLPQQIATFISDLYSGFRLLNLRNDALRRKFDSLKYDTMKVEEILYDCKVRGLGAASTGSVITPEAIINASSKPLAVAADPTDVNMQ